MSCGKNINMKCSMAIILGMAAVVKSAGIEASHHRRVSLDSLRECRWYYFYFINGEMDLLNIIHSERISSVRKGVSGIGQNLTCFL